MSVDAHHGVVGHEPMNAVREAAPREVGTSAPRIERIARRDVGRLPRGLPERADDLRPLPAWSGAGPPEASRHLADDIGVRTICDLELDLVKRPCAGTRHGRAHA